MKELSSRLSASVEILRPGLALLKTTRGGCVVIASVDAFTTELTGATAQSKEDVAAALAKQDYNTGKISGRVGEKPLFGLVVVDEGHHVFARATSETVDGQTRFTDSKRVREVLEHCMDPKESRLIIFHDQSHQPTGTKVDYSSGIRLSGMRKMALKHIIRLPAAVRDISVPFCKDLDRPEKDGLVPVYPLIDENVVGAEVQFVEVSKTYSALRNQNNVNDTEYLENMKKYKCDIESEALACEKAYAEALAKHLVDLAQQRQTAGAPKFRPDLVAVLWPQMDLEIIRRVRKAVVDMLRGMEGPQPLGIEVASAVASATEGYTKAEEGEAVGEYDPTQLFWGRIQDFVGMERPLVISAGFRHPQYLLDRQRDGKLKLQVDPLAYQTLTRCTYRLSIVEPFAKDFGRHYQIHLKDSEGNILQSGDAGNRVKTQGFWDETAGCIRLQQTVDLRALVAAEANPPKDPTASVQDAVWLRISDPFSLADWRKVNWGRCKARLKQLELVKCLSPELGCTATEMLEVIVRDLPLLKRLVVVDHESLSTLPESITVLTSLQTLVLANNKLEALPEGISALTLLQKLGLMNNKLEALPEGISALTSLQQLNLINNELVVSPLCLFILPSLSELYIDNYQLHRFGKVFWQPLMSKTTVHEVRDGEERGRRLANLDARKLKRLMEDTRCTKEACTAALRRTVGDTVEAKKMVLLSKASSTGGGGAV